MALDIIYHRIFHIFNQTCTRFGPDIERKIRLTIYHIPRIMVPVRTWQQRQQLVEYHRSHGEIIIYPGVCFKLFHECCRKMNYKRLQRPRTATSSVCLRRCSLVSASGVLPNREPLIWLIPESRDQGRILTNIRGMDAKMLYNHTKYFRPNRATFKGFSLGTVTF